jgi:hypothetical protein
VAAVKKGNGAVAEQLLRDHIVERGEQTLHGSRGLVLETPRAVPPRRRGKRRDGQVPGNQEGPE